MNHDPARIHQKLRQPDFGRYRTPQALAKLLEDGSIDICRPFSPWVLPDTPTWAEDPYLDDTWGLYYHALGWLITLDYGIDNAPDISKGEACATRLRFLLLSYLRHLSDTLEPDSHKMVWFDHSTAWRASAIAYLYERHFKGSASLDEVALFHAAARQHETKLRDFIKSGRWKANNHGIFHAEALWDLASVFEDALDAESVRATALAAMRSVFAEMIDFEEGVCREQSIYYHLFDASLLVDSARYMDQFGIEVVPGYRDVLRKMLDFFHAFCPEGEFLQPIGDTQYGAKGDSRLLQNVATAISYTTTTTAKTDTRPIDPTLHTYPRNGYYLFKSPSITRELDSFAVLIDKPYHGAHGHADGGSFMLNRGGEPFLVDSGGPYAYGKPLRFKYFKAAEAHNVVIFDRVSRNYLTRVSSVSQGTLGNSVRLETTDLEGGKWQRTAVSLQDGTYVLIDRLARNETGTIDILFHLAPAIDVERLVHSSFRLKGQTSSLDMWQTSNAQIEVFQNSGEEGFPRGLITRELAKQEASQVLTTSLNARDAWVVTVMGTQASTPLVHTLYGGKVARILTHGAQAIGIDCNLEDTAAPVRIYSFRTH